MEASTCEHISSCRYLGNPIVSMLILRPKATVHVQQAIYRRGSTEPALASCRGDLAILIEP
jgi:hypothetical protein